jgi:thiosulfate dehydrogenase [quinone] large subunit
MAIGKVDLLEEGRVSCRLLVVLRLHLGVILLLTVTGKLTGDGPFAEQMLQFLQRGAGRPGQYGGFLREVVIPHATLFSYLVMSGELFAGLSLLLGAATRLGAGVAMFLFLMSAMARATRSTGAAGRAEAPIRCQEHVFSSSYASNKGNRA